MPDGKRRRTRVTMTEEEEQAGKMEHYKARSVFEKGFLKCCLS